MRFGVLYPDHLSRWKTLLRIFFLIPVWLVFYVVSLAFEGLALVGWTGAFWRKKYPSWAFRGITGILDYQARAMAYALLLTDRFPSIDREQTLVRLDFEQPQPGQLSRWRVFFWKLLLIIPHYVVLSFLFLALFVVTVLAWFGILFTGNYPRGMFGFAQGVMRWQFRVTAYFLSLNDRFPPYSLSDEAGAGGNASAVASGIGGAVVVGGFVALIVVAVIASSTSHTEDVDYAALQSGSATTTRVSTFGGDVLVRLQRVTDPGDSLIQVVRHGAGEKVIVFEWRIANDSGRSVSIAASQAHLTALVNDGGDSKEHGYGAEFVIVGDQSAPVGIADGAVTTVEAVFVVPADARPTELQFHHGFLNRGGITYRFH